MRNKKRFLRKSTVTRKHCFLLKGRLREMKDFLKAVLFVTVLFVLLYMLFSVEGTSSADDHGVMENEGIIVYKYVNFRSTPDSTNDENIICKLYFGDIVDVVSVEGEWKKVIYDGQEGYLIGESFSEYYIMLDISDFNWGSEYKTIEEFKTFTERAKNSTKFVGYYIQVQRTFKENAHWKEITACLDEMGINYGLYLYSSATTQEGAAKEYESYLNIIDGVSLKYNKYPFMIDLEGGPCVAKRLSGCGSGTEYLAVTPWGDLYPCHQFVGNEKFLMGNVWDGVTATEIRDEFKCCNVYAKEKCRNCFAKFYCSGGCAANSYNFHGKITDAYDVGCALEKKRVECAIMIKAAEADME